MRASLLVLLLLPAALAAQARRATPAARWTRVGATAQGNPVFIDLRTVQRRDSLVSGTVRATFNTPVRTPQGNVTSSRTIVTVNCRQRKVAVHENWLYHDERRGTVFEHRKPRVPGYGSPIRGTLSEVAMNHLCSAPR